MGTHISLPRSSARPRCQQQQPSQPSLASFASASSSTSPSHSAVERHWVTATGTATTCPASGHVTHTTPSCRLPRAPLPQLTSKYTHHHHRRKLTAHDPQRYT